MVLPYITTSQGCLIGSYSRQKFSFIYILYYNIFAAELITLPVSCVLSIRVMCMIYRPLIVQYVVLVLVMKLMKSIYIWYVVGHQHKKMVLFCPCEDDAVTLVKLQLWPGSAKRPQVAFHSKLMMLAEMLLLECHVSLKKFCDTLGLEKSNILPTWVSAYSDIYQVPYMEL